MLLSASFAHAQLSPTESQSLAENALSLELASAADLSHPMRYELKKSSPRVETRKAIYETKDGDVARLLEINGAKISADDQQKELARLDALDHDTGKQQHRKDSERTDQQRVVTVLSAMPHAFLYTWSGIDHGISGPCTRLDFRPDPRYQPQEMETRVLASMAGQICVDTNEHRVEWLYGRVLNDVDFGWGILGRLHKDGWIRIDQSRVDADHWRIVRLQMKMSARLLVRTLQFDMTEEESNFAPLPEMDYHEAIRQLRASY